MPILTQVHYVKVLFFLFDFETGSIGVEPEVIEKNKWLLDNSEEFRLYKYVKKLGGEFRPLFNTWSLKLA